MNFSVNDLYKTFEDSVVIQTINKIRTNQIGTARNLLKPNEIQLLEKQGNRSSDWSKIKVSSDFSTAGIYYNQFLGEVELNHDGIRTIQKLGSIEYQSGIYHSTFYNAKISRGTLINYAGTLNNIVVDENAIIEHCGHLTGEGASTFGNGQELTLVIETGGREVLIFAEITLEIASQISLSRKNIEVLNEYRRFISDYAKKVSSNWAYVGKSVQIFNAGKIVNCFLDYGTKIENVHYLSNSTVLSNLEERTTIVNGAHIENSIIQWGATIDSMGYIERSVLSEHTHIKCHGKVINSIIGANTGIAAGEVISSIVGPFVGFHHQALLIATYWPEGKGNVAYGSNIGSNHTSRAPDQELWPGEGTFFGLGCNIKFPANFSKAPYTIIATGVFTLPQHLEFPFSLISCPSNHFPHISPAYNEIIPGWVLSYNYYFIKRNEAKFAQRNKAKRSHFIFEVLRPEIMNLILVARNKLKDVLPKEVYTDEDILGLGKNYLMEAHRQIGLSAYNFFIEYYCLRGVRNRLSVLLLKREHAKISDFFSATTQDHRWEHERKLLLQEFGMLEVEVALTRLQELELKIAQSVQISKEKDDLRGRDMIPDYNEAHIQASDDPFVKKTWEEWEKINSGLKSLISQLKDETPKQIG